MSWRDVTQRGRQDTSVGTDKTEAAETSKAGKDKTEAVEKYMKGSSARLSSKSSKAGRDDAIKRADGRWRLAGPWAR